MVSALIQITQGAHTDVAGRAVVGDADSGNVTVTNGDNTDVTSWTITLLSVPVGSATTTGVKGTGVSGTPTATFSVDGTPGCYRIKLEVTDGENVDYDIRNFAIRADNGIIHPSLGDPVPLTTKPNEFNFGGQNRGWMGDDTYKMVDWALSRIDQELPGGGSLGDYLQQLPAGEVGLSFPRNVISVGDGWLMANGPAGGTAQGHPNYTVAGSVAYSADGDLWATKAYDIVDHYPTQVVREPVTGKVWMLVESKYTTGNQLYWREITSLNPITFGAAEHPLLNFSSPAQQQKAVAVSAGDGLIFVTVNSPSPKTIAYDASTTPPTAVADTGSAMTTNLTLFWDPTDRYGDGDGRLFEVSNAYVRRWEPSNWTSAEYSSSGFTVDGINVVPYFYGWAADVTSGYTYFVGRNSSSGNFHLFRVGLEPMFDDPTSILLSADPGGQPLGITVDHATGDVCVLFKGGTGTSYIVFANFNGSSFNILGETTLEAEWLAGHAASGYPISPEPPLDARAAFAGGKHIFPLNGLPYGAPPSNPISYVALYADPADLSLTPAANISAPAWSPSDLTLRDILENDNSANDMRIRNVGRVLEADDAVPVDHLQHLNVPWVVAGISEVVGTLNLGLYGNYRGLRWKSDGMCFYLMNYNANKIVEFAVGAPWDVASAYLTGKELNFSGQFTGGARFVFSPSGHRLYITSGTTSEPMYQYNLGTNWDLSTATYATSKTISPVALSSNLEISPDGSTLYLSTNIAIYQYSLSSPFDLSTLAWSGKVLLLPDIDAIVAFAIAPEGALYSPTGIPGKKLILSIQEGSDAWMTQYTLGTSWDIETATSDEIYRVIATGQSLGSVAFSPDGCVFTHLHYKSEDSTDELLVRRVAVPNYQEGIDNLREDIALDVAGLESDIADLSADIAAVAGGIPAPYASTPEPVGTANSGSSDDYARGNHSHAQQSVAPNKVLGTAFGGSTGAATSLDIGQLVATCQDADGGNYKLRVAPDDAQAITSLATATSVNLDFDPGVNGYFRFAVTVLVKLASAGTYRRTSANIEATRISGTMTVEGSQVNISGGNSTGLAITLSHTGGSLRVAVANTTGETINGRCLVGWSVEDLLP